MRKIKGILPTLREKKRYVSYKIISENTINMDRALEIIKSKILSFMGILNYGKAGIMFLSSRNSNVIKVKSNFLDQLRTSLILIKEIDGNDVIIKTTNVSGILKKLNNA